MNKKLLIATIVAAFVIPIVAYAVPPYFINTSIDEPLPTSSKKAMEEKAMAEKKAMEDNQSLFGTFVGVDSIHTAQGIAKVISLDDGTSVLRLEDFKSTNGPDLYVYLATDEKATDFVNLGRLKANNGNQNYDIPDGTDLSKYDSVLIWCKQFSVLFGNAELNSS